ncbi:hypothetical protein C8R41DRAFT_924331 [Lentinula lateritia]|uniref:Uncharacterized protein n=1 Tax=Lentinula lateritia TaxID=40482 RepID=A0ABQ8V3M1_9AGAR|nr:hypothetical protein C8R41DRAFT_924331 [Lentinula lateritia]
MPSIAMSNDRHVRFSNELAKPSSDRHRIDGLVYPRVAQIKGEANKQDSFDFYWKFECLSAVSRVGTMGTVEVKGDERTTISPDLSQVQCPPNPSRYPRMTLTQSIGEVTPKLSSTPLSKLLQNESTLSVLCTPPLLCASRLVGGSSSLDGDGSYSSSAYSSSSSDSDF